MHQEGPKRFQKARRHVVPQTEDIQLYFTQNLELRSEGHSSTHHKVAPTSAIGSPLALEASATPEGVREDGPPKDVESETGEPLASPTPGSSENLASSSASSESSSDEETRAEEEELPRREGKHPWKEGT
jgi:hypothetical protein